MSEWLPVFRETGYLPIEDHGLIGDGSTAALVGRDGSIVWLCVPRFDSPPLFAAILDADHGGRFRIAPEGATESRQSYLENTAVLVTEIRSPSGTIEIADALTLRAGADLSEDASADRSELVRLVSATEGEPDLTVVLSFPDPIRVERAGDGFHLSLRAGDSHEAHFETSIPLNGLATRFKLRQGERAWFRLRWHSGSHGRRVLPEQALSQTADAWRAWIRKLRYEGPREPLVRRSAITLKLLDHFRSGGMVAAPTSSLPESIGGRRNWDYRYVWIRDAAFSVYAFHRIGFFEEAGGFLGWVLNAIEREQRPRVLYDIDGNFAPRETEDRRLQGYRKSAPVRWGNAAADQIQHDVYGEILDCAYLWAKYHGSLDDKLWDRIRQLVDDAAKSWRTPDQGIWEVRTAARPFTYSAALCHVALSRGSRLAEKFSLAEEAQRWKAAAAEIHAAILKESWDPQMGAFTEHLGGGGLDASLLSLPLRRVIAADHPMMVSTVEAIRRRLDAGNGLLYRYLPEASPDGLPGPEGAFLLCSFWLVDNLTAQGRVEEATDLFNALCDRASPLGLLPEQIDPVSGTFLGNFPQGFSHIGVISSGVNLSGKHHGPHR